MGRVQKIFYLFCFLVCSISASSQQQAFKIHSHNDYSQKQPFWNAWKQGAASIEADVLLENGIIMVAHEKESVQQGKDLWAMYLDPLKSALQSATRPKQLCLLIDLKTDAYPTLRVLTPLLQKFVEENRSLLQTHKVWFVISGNRPTPKDYSNYPSFIMFDHQELNDLTKEQLGKVFMMSFSFKNFSQWKGKDKLPEADEKKIIDIVSLVHTMQKPVRFWATPDTKTAWRTLFHLGVDYINTDNPKKAAHFLKRIQRKESQH